MMSTLTSSESRACIHIILVEVSYGYLRLLNNSYLHQHTSPIINCVSHSFIITLCSFRQAKNMHLAKQFDFETLWSLSHRIIVFKTLHDNLFENCLHDATNKKAAQMVQKRP